MFLDVEVMSAERGSLFCRREQRLQWAWRTQRSRPMAGWRRYVCPETRQEWLSSEDSQECFWVHKPGDSGWALFRVPGQLPVVQTETETAGVEPAADQQFRLCVSAPDCRHIAAAGSSVMNISQL